MAPVAYRFDETRHERGLRVGGQVLDDLGNVDIGLIADREEPSDSEPARRQVPEDQSAVCAALGNDADAAWRGWQIPEIRAVQLRGRRVHAHAVRAHDAQSRGARGSEQAGLDTAAVS